MGRSAQSVGNAKLEPADLSADSVHFVVPALYTDNTSWSFTDTRRAFRGYRAADLAAAQATHVARGATGTSPAGSDVSGLPGSGREVSGSAGAGPTGVNGV